MKKIITDIQNIEGNRCKAAIGYDCKGLYSYAIKQKMQLEYLSEDQHRGILDQKLVRNILILMYGWII